MSTGLNDTEFAQAFQNPAAIYRDLPFWGWNGALDREQIIRQIEVFRKMGMGGFFIHSRSGLATEYLGPEFLAMVKLSVSKAYENGLYACLYDEDRYPSGYGGGLVTQNAKYVSRFLRVFMDTPQECAPVNKGGEIEGELLCCYQVCLDDAGRLKDYARCASEASLPVGYRKMRCYKVLASPSTWFNNHAYLDTLNPEATKRFLQVTHERYAHAVGSHFGQTVPAIFTDEPCHAAFRLPKNVSETGAVAALPYTDSFPDSYRRAYDADVFASLPEVIWDAPSGYSQARYRYHDHTAELFARNFSQIISRWCKEHNLQFAGHMLGECFLESQTASTGDVMRHYLHFDIPGVDVLCDSLELTTVKQCQSICRQAGKRKMLSELDGVTDWDFPFFCHKGHGDWQAALGVTMRVPHHALMSLAGEAKRDYPASIGEQSPWYEKYPLIADHFSRINVAMSRGKPCCRVGVIHPIESYWLIDGPREQTASHRKQMEEDFRNLTEILTYGLIDFDFISESALPRQAPSATNGKAIVGCMQYDVILIPSCVTLRSSTLAFLELCAGRGVRLTVVGTPPELVDAAPNMRLECLLSYCSRIPLSRHHILQELEPYRDIAISDSESCTPADKLIYQLREEDNGSRLLFIANTDRIGTVFRADIALHGSWQLIEYSTADGTSRSRDAVVYDAKTKFQYCFPPHGHLLLQLMPAERSEGDAFRSFQYLAHAIEKSIVCRISGQHVPVTLTESNLLPLDMAQWRIDSDSSWRPREEILRIEDQIRNHFSLRNRNGVSAQPWCDTEAHPALGTLSLRFTIRCEAAINGCELAGEDLSLWSCRLDAQEVPMHDNGYWCDQSIRKARLPLLLEGEHTLILTCSYSAKTVLEPFYLLGDFSVTVRDDTAAVSSPIKCLSWGDITQQGLPFYSGNIIYHTTFKLSEKRSVALRIPSRMSGYGVPTEIRDNHATREIPFAGFSGTLVAASVDGQQKADIAFAPFQTSLGELECGEHALDLCLYTHRKNSMGALHQTFRSTLVGPDIWRQVGEDFCYSYRLSPIGIFVNPLLLRE